MYGDLKLSLAPPAPEGMPSTGDDEAMASVSLRLLGQFELRVDGQLVTLPGSTQRLIAYLGLRGTCGRSRLAGTLWPDTTESRALGCLRTAIWRVNQTAPGLVSSAAGSAELAPRADVDVNRVVVLSQSLLAGSGPIRLHELEPSGVDLLPEWDDEWLTLDRERLRQLQLHVLEAQAERLMEQDSYGLALECAIAALRAEPLRESAHRAVIRIHLAEGNLTEARRSYEQCVDLFDRELGVSPSRVAATLIPAQISRLSGDDGVTAG